MVTRVAETLVDTDEEKQVLMSSLTGLRVINAHWEDPAAKETWSDHGLFTLEFENGLIISFWSTGYDASAVHVTVDHEPAL